MITNKILPLISIIMPAYNAEKYILSSVESVISQTFKNWELIVIDDGSKDNTMEILKKIKDTDNRIRLIENETNMGVSLTRNRGIEIARSEWIAFLDSDDLWSPFKLEKQLLIAQKNDAEFVFSGASYINESSKPFNGIFEVPSIVTFDSLKKQNVISCSSVLLKRYFFDDVKMENDQLHEDYVVWLKILKSGCIAHGINEPLLIYRLSTKSKSGNKLKSVSMTYRVFRFIGINPIQSAYFTSRHIIGSFFKYKKIFYQSKH